MVNEELKKMMPSDRCWLNFSFPLTLFPEMLDDSHLFLWFRYIGRISGL